MSSKQLQKLEQQKQKKRDELKTLDARIRQEQSKENRRKKKLEDRRKILVGAYVLTMLEKDGKKVEIHPHGDDLMQQLETFYTGKSEREFFGFSVGEDKQTTA